MANDAFVSNLSTVDVGLSDHSAILFNFEISYSPRPVARTVSFHKWQSVDPVAFANSINAWMICLLSLLRIKLFYLMPLLLIWKFLLLLKHEMSLSYIQLPSIMIICVQRRWNVTNWSVNGVALACQFLIKLGKPVWASIKQKLILRGLHIFLRLLTIIITLGRSFTSLTVYWK